MMDDKIIQMFPHSQRLSSKKQNANMMKARIQKSLSMMKGNDLILTQLQLLADRVAMLEDMYADLLVAMNVRLNDIDNIVD